MNARFPPTVHPGPCRGQSPIITGRRRGGAPKLWACHALGVGTAAGGATRSHRSRMRCERVLATVPSPATIRPLFRWLHKLFAVLRGVEVIAPVVSGASVRCAREGAFEAVVPAESLDDVVAAVGKDHVN